MALDKKLLDQISKLETDDLRALNKIVVAQINANLTIQSHLAISEMHIGERVTFRGRRGRQVTGVIERINQTTLSIREEGHGGALGMGWRVPASLVSKVA